jgi:isoleucyl-tRNA synthetase
MEEPYCQRSCIGKVSFPLHLCFSLANSFYSDGKKMSKSKKNFPDPNLILEEYGADVLRLYLINSPVVRAEPLRFDEKGLKSLIASVFLPWYNAYRFFFSQLALLKKVWITRCM